MFEAVGTLVLTESELTVEVRNIATPGTGLVTILRAGTPIFESEFAVVEGYGRLSTTERGTAPVPVEPGDVVEVLDAEGTLVLTGTFRRGSPWARTRERARLST